MDTGRMATIDRPASQGARLLSMKVRRCSDGLDGEAHLAQWYGIDLGQLAEPSDEVARAVVDLDFIIARAQMVWDPAVVPAWLHGSSAFFEGATPLEMVRRGRTSEVLDAITAEAATTFA